VKLPGIPAGGLNGSVQHWLEVRFPLLIVRCWRSDSPSSSHSVLSSNFRIGDHPTRTSDFHCYFDSRTAKCSV
jgi:hypothetical protein